MIPGIVLVGIGLLLLAWWRRSARKHRSLPTLSDQFFIELLELVTDDFDLLGKPVLMGILLIIIGLVVILVNL